MELPSAKCVDEYTAGDEEKTEYTVLNSPMNGQLQKQIKFRNDKTKSHQRYSCTKPGQKCSLIRQNVPRIRILSNKKSPSLSHVPCLVLQDSALNQLKWLGHKGLFGRFQLIYWDPPFFSGKERTAVNGSFKDQWSSLQEYVAFVKEHFVQFLPFLSPTGFFVLHCDYHASHYLKILGDELLGYDNFRNEVIWHYRGRRQKAIVRVNSKHDSLLIWAKSGEARMNPIFDSWDRDYYVRMKKQPVHADEDGREWIWGHKGKGQSKAYRIYLDEVIAQGRAIDNVWDIPIINTSAHERVGYPTQKPLKLMERVVLLLTQPGDWVLDTMAGSGTTGVAAWSLDRPVCLGDNNPEAVAIMLRRLKQLIT